MKKATISNLKNNLSAYLRTVRAGQTVIIYDRDVPVARLERIENNDQASDRLTHLQAQGILKPPLRPISGAALRELLSNPLGRSVKLAEAVQEDRRDDR